MVVVPSVTDDSASMLLYAYVSDSPDGYSCDVRLPAASYFVVTVFVCAVPLVNSCASS